MWMNESLIVLLLGAHPVLENRMGIFFAKMSAEDERSGWFTGQREDREEQSVKAKCA